MNADEYAKILMEDYPKPKIIKKLWDAFKEPVLDKDIDDNLIEGVRIAFYTAIILFVDLHVILGKKLNHHQMMMVIKAIHDELEEFKNE